MEIDSTRHDVLSGDISIRGEHPQIEWRVESGDDFTFDDSLSARV